MPMPDQSRSLSELDGHLWGDANILRCPLDHTALKTELCPLLFLKRVCGVWDEAYQEIVGGSGDEQLLGLPESPLKLRGSITP